MVEQLLGSQFNQPSTEVTKVYDHFKGASMINAWTTIVWKSYLQPSYFLTFWMLAQKILSTWDRQSYMEDRSCGLVEEM